jgi:NAD(P)-dependent dehydrogenase (short-subunit alcohol dehydrogenase family)
MLNDKKILVTGAAGLLGSHLTVALVQAGAHVIAADLDDERVVRRLEKAGIGDGLERVTTAALDVTDEAAVRQFFARDLAIDGAVNCTYPRNARYGAKFPDVTLADFNENLSLHLGSSFLFLQQCAAYFTRVQLPLAVVNISSIYGVVAPRFELYAGTAMTMAVEYAAIKSALVHLSRYAVTYVADSRFRVNCVSPGGILDGQPESFLAKYRAETLGRGMLAPGDIAGTIIFLLSDQAGAINGQNIVVDDGFTL